MESSQSGGRLSDPAPNTTPSNPPEPPSPPLPDNIPATRYIGHGTWGGFLRSRSWKPVQLAQGELKRGGGDLYGSVDTLVPLINCHWPAAQQPLSSYLTHILPLYLDSNFNLTPMLPESWNFSSSPDTETSLNAETLLNLETPGESLDF